MRSSFRSYATILTASAALIGTACGGHDKSTTASNGDVATPATNSGYSAQPVTRVDSTPASHHSKIGGALAGAVAGHALGGHAVLGAATGALVQHERNKHERQH